MKKLFALIIALVLILSMTAALAEDKTDSKTVTATYEKGASYASDDEVYALTFAWSGAISTNLVFKGDKYVWNATEMKYELAEAGGFDKDATSPAAYSVSFTNCGNKGYTCSLSFTANEGIDADFAADTVKSVAIASAAPAFDLTKLNEVSEAKEASLSGSIKISSIDTDEISLSATPAGDGSIEADADNTINVGILMLTISAN